MDESLNQERGLTDGAGAGVELRRALASIRPWARARAAPLLCAALLAAASLQMLAVISRKSITIDEIVMIPAAYYHLAAANFQLVHEHPPLSKILAALPLLLVQPDEVQPHALPGPPDSPESKATYQDRFWEDNRAAFKTISFWARMPMIALTVALGALLFVFARETFGDRAAVFAVALFSLEPTVLAHGRVVQTDVPAAFGYLLTTFALYGYAQAPAWRRAFFVGAAGGLAILAKFSMLLVGPVVGAFFLLMLWRAPGGEGARKRTLGHAVLTAVSALLVINAGYFFQGNELTERDAQWVAGSFPESASIVWTTIKALSHVLPTEFVLGVFWQFWHNAAGHQGSLLGTYSATGWWYYFPVAFVLKVPLPHLLLSIASLAWSTYVLFKKRDRRLLFVLAPFVLYTAFVLLSRINIGVRYYLPAFPFLFIMSGALLDALLRRLRHHEPAGVLIVALVLGWAGVESVRAFPHHLSYFNQLTSGQPRWWYLSDSNVEWGDDVPALASYLRERGETRVRGAFLGGHFTPRYYGVEYLDMLSRTASELPPTRYVAIGASYLNGSTVTLNPRADGTFPTEEERVNRFAEYRTREPEKIFGGSIYLFREDE